MRTPVPLFGPEVYNGIEERGLQTDIFTGWHSKDPFFETVIGRAKPKTIIEVGTWKGGSAIHMAGLAPEAKIYCVDHWLGGCDHITADCAFRQGVQRDTHGWPGIYYQFLHNVKVSHLQERIVPVPMLTTDGAELLKLHGIMAELIYIDADHHEEPARNDIRAYLPMLAPGGIMFGDDFYLSDVKRAVASVFGDKIETAPGGGFWAFQNT